MHKSIPAALISACLAVGCSQPANQAPATDASNQAQAQAPSDSSATNAMDSNPFFTASTLPYLAPDFSRIQDAHYLPAFTEGMRQQLQEIKQVADRTDAPTFDNTLIPLERSGALLTRVSKVFFNLTESNTNESLQNTQTEIAPKLAAHQDQIFLDPRLFARVKAVYEARDGLNDPEAKRLAERYYQAFVRAGALLSEADKTKIRALNEEQSKLATQFQENLLKETNDAAVVIDDQAQLDGLSEADISAAAEAAKARNLEGKWLLTLQNTSGQPLLASLKNRAVREKLYQASVTRGIRGNAYDTTAIVARIAQLRAERAKLLGYDTAAAYVLDDQMAKTPQAAVKMLADLAPAAVANAKAEAAEMQKLIDAQNGGFQLAAWDWAFYAELVRKAKYDLDESQIRPYFELDRVLRDGVFYAMNQLYGIRFEERKDLPTYHPDVRVYEVFDKDNQAIGLFYADYFKRDSKRGGAWMDTFVDQSGLLGTKPVVVNVLNIAKPAPGQPALLSYDEVSTLFHEMGHGVHGLFSNVKYPMLSGTNVPRDFVEFPSQFNENWALEPKVLANYAKHYQTGEAMPAALVEKIQNSQKFNQGFATLEYLKAALLDLEWHQLSADQPKQEVLPFEEAALKKYGIEFAAVPPRYRTAYFAHVWPGGYSAGYYAYLWSEVLALDAYAWFKEHGGLNSESAQRFRDKVISRGGTQEAMQLYRDFSGKDPSIEPLLEARGLKPAHP